MKHPWFKNTKYGLWPANTHGWLVVVVLLSLLAARIISVLLFKLPDNVFLAAFPYLLALSALLFIIAYHTSAKAFWFRSKRYGWGWTPSTWQGWYLVALFVASIIFAAQLSSVLYTDDMNAMILHIDAATVALAIILVWISYKTGEKPRWRWGK